jgi:hypothetical protein
MGDAQQRPCMVGQEAPTADTDTLSEFPETEFMFL